MNFLKYVVGLAAALALTACGGGGGNPGTVSGSSGGGSITSKATLVVQIFNSANTAVSNVTFGGGNYVKATFKDANGVPIVNRLVTFSLNGATTAVISPTTALTNSLGEAQVSISPASVATQGAATVSAQAVDASATSYSGSTDFALAAAAITLGPLTLGSSALSPGGNTSVTTFAQSNSVAAAGINVSLIADCGTINPVVTTDGSGGASATYSAVKTDGTSCRGLVTISASAVGTTVQKATLTVAAPVANAINFVSATPAQIFVKGSGATEQSIAKFKVLDSTGVAMPNIPVVFSLSVNPGGVGLGASGVTVPVTANSDASGIASVSVFSGTIPGPVEVKAALIKAVSTDPEVFTTSKNLTVASGPPSQNFFSLSVDTFNIEGWNIDGTSTNLTVRVGDRQGNPVPDGTVVNFTAEGGQVATSCATTRVNGIAQCSVAFISQNPRPADGRVSVLAYAEGLKQFTDVNGNNAYEAGTDTLSDLGDAYRDDNEDGQYNVGEFVIPKGGVTPCAGTGGAFPSRANTCTGIATLAATVRQQTQLMFASSAAAFTVTTPATASAITFVTVRINSADHSLFPMPAGTVVSADALSSACTIGKISPSVVPNTSPGTTASQLGSSHSIGLTGCGGSTIIVKATAPSGLVSPFPYTVAADVTAPTNTAAPAVEAITTAGATLTARIDEAGTGYYKVQLTALPAPSVAGVIAANNSFAMTANNTVGVSFVGLATATPYTVYFVARDAAGNTQATVSSVAFTTQ